MAPQTTRSTAKTAEPSVLYHHERIGAFQCMGCWEMIEIPSYAVVRSGSQPVPIKGDPLNLLLWKEIIEIAHRPCEQFSDVRLAEQARQHRSPILLRSHHQAAH